MTHSGKTSISRLERSYSSEHLVEQMASELHAVALEWRPDLYRAVMVARRLPVNIRAETKLTAQSCYAHLDFPRRCHLDFEEKLQNNPEASKLQQLGLLKEVMWGVVTSMRRSSSAQAAATETADKMGVTMRLIRAVEDEHASLSTISSCLMRYSHSLYINHKPI